MKFALFSKRSPGEPACPRSGRVGICPSLMCAWRSRRLRRVIASGRAGVLGASGWESSIRRESPWWPTGRNGFGKKHDINLWEAEGVLDVFHALEHLSDTARILYGEQTAQAEGFRERGREQLLSAGFEGLVPLLEEIKHPTQTPEQRAAIDALETYLGHHAGHLHYALRLSKGQSIGSGQIEGACKNLVGRRLKQTGIAGVPAASTEWQACVPSCIATTGKPIGIPSSHKKQKSVTAPAIPHFKQPPGKSVVRSSMVEKAQKPSPASPDAVMHDSDRFRLLGSLRNPVV